MNHIEKILHRDSPSSLYTGVTVGQVVDANDPQQMGRLRILCPALGDSPDMLIKDIPWASYLSPFGGTVDVGSRGRSDDLTTGPVAYGMWAIPKVGATALVVCIDGDPRFRVWVGCMHGQFLPHTLPHGRFSNNDRFGEGEPAGPVSSEEEPIQPTAQQLELAFTKSQDTVSAGIPATPKVNNEWKTRGADHGVSKINNEQIRSDFSDISLYQDDEDQGYSKSRIQPNLTSEVTGDVKDSQVYSWTTPGFHAMSMDDSPDNCRIRLRTTHGNQILLDDTNERIYISTPQGDSWIEMDEKGNIDIYAKRNISYHAEKDINFTAGGTFRVKAAKGIHLISETEFRIHAKAEDVQLISGANVRIQSTADTEIKTGGSLIVETAVDINMKATGAGILASGGVLNLNGGGNVLITGPRIDLNGPSADPGSGVTTDHKEAFWTNRIPEHEPWPRVMTKVLITDDDTDNTHVNAAEYLYDDPLIGKVERGDDLNRNDKWRR